MTTALKFIKAQNAQKSTQVVVFIQIYGVNLKIREECREIFPMLGTTTVSDIFGPLVKVLTEYNW